MVKIQKNIIIIFFILAAVAASIHPLMVLPDLPYKLFLVYVLMFTAAFFMVRDIKVEKKLFKRAVLFILGTALLAAGQYVFSFFKHEIMGYGALLMLAGIILLIPSNLLRENKNDEKAEIYGLKFEIAAVFTIATAAFILRFWDLSNFLPGIWFDEAQNGTEALRIMQEGRLEIFISRYTHMPAMYFYFAALSIKIFGFNIFSLRLVSCILGSLSVVSFYFLAKQIFKNAKYALLAAVLLAFSRWHITFSRVAFLGMQTVFFEIIFLYFYLKFYETKNAFHALLAGALLGLSQYTFSAANFIAVFVVLHVVFRTVKDVKGFFSANGRGIIIMTAAALITAAPLINYAVSQRGAFFQRAADVSIMNDIKENKNISPVFRNLKTYALIFNFEGDYNGRHNLYKKPILDDISGCFFIIGLIAVFLTAGLRFIPGLFLIMILPGIMTLTIEAPQTYRIIGVIPAVYLIITMGVKTAAGLLQSVSKEKHAATVFALAAALSMAVINFHQYFILYPKHEGTYMSFSPESNGIAQFIKRHIDEYEILVSTAGNMYGFYMWEQSVISDFVNYGKRKYHYLSDTNVIDNKTLSDKKGVVVITRPSDEDIIIKLEKEYAGKITQKKVFTNPHNGLEIYTCWFINKDDISVLPGRFMYRR